jgi:hypothetical protein
MKVWALCLVFLVCCGLSPQISIASSNITPEQIFQPDIHWPSLIGTWEVLPEDSPLAEPETNGQKAKIRTMLALRKDGTCRIFDHNHPTGSDGLWTWKDHEMVITLPGSANVGFYVYGIKGDFMITRSPIKNGKDQLWSRVK